eukprot:47539_1
MLSNLNHIRRCFSSINQSIVTGTSHAQPHGYYNFKAPQWNSYLSAMEKLKKLPLTTIVDALWTLQYPQPMLQGINKITTESQTENHVGLAITLRFVPYRNDLMNYKPKGYESPEYFAFNMVEHEANGYKYSIVMETVGAYESVGGDIKLSMLQSSQNLSCIVCDGGIRDIETVQHYNIPIYAASVTCKQGPATQIPWSVNEVICLNNNIVCTPYDYIVADKYNVVVVPQCNVDKVIQIADIRETIEDVIKLEVDKNSDTVSIIPHYYPFPTPLTRKANAKLVDLLKQYNKWDHIESMQKDVFS